MVNCTVLVKKVLLKRCEFCNKELNKSYLGSHIKKQHLYPRVPTQGYSHSFAQVPAQGYPRVPTQGYSQGYSRSFTQVPAQTGGDLLPVQVPKQVPTLNNINNNNDNDNKCNRTLKLVHHFVVRLICC